MALIWDYLARRMAPLLDKALYHVCFVRKQQSGGDLAWKLGVGINDLWMCNPHMSSIETVWRGEVLLVPQRLFRPALPWRDVSHDFTLAHWPRRVEDFPTYPRKDDFLDGAWEPPVPQNLKAITGTGGREAMWGRFQYVDDTSGDKDGIR